MSKWNQIKRWTVRSIAVCLGLGMLLGMPTTAWASSRIKFNPPGGGAPRETKGGASRGDITCATTPSREAAQIILLSPRGTSVGLTTLERPTFFAYVPPSSAQQARFHLRTAAGKSHYSTKLSVPRQGGIVRIALPESAAPLALNQAYEWGVVLLCGGQLRADSPVAIATIQRAPLSVAIARRLTNQPPLERAAIYAENGFWYEMLSHLAELRQQQPQDQTIAQTWTQILTTAGLTRVASAPLVTGL